MSRTLQEIQEMAKKDYAIGLTAHYKPLADFINRRNYKIGVEIGTAYAGNAVHLLANTRLDKLVTVDPFEAYEQMPGLSSAGDYEQLFMFAYHRLSIYNNCVVIRATSKVFFDALDEDKINNRSEFDHFDFFFIDGNHTFDNVFYECFEASKYIREGGALIGHDYNVFEDVNKAVNQFAAERNKEVNLLDGNIWYINM